MDLDPTAVRVPTGITVPTTGWVLLDCRNERGFLNTQRVHPDAPALLWEIGRCGSERWNAVRVFDPAT